MKCLANLTKTLETKVKCKTKFCKQSWEYFSGQFYLYNARTCILPAVMLDISVFKCCPLLSDSLITKKSFNIPRKRVSDQIIILRCTGEHSQQLSDSFIMHYYMMVPPIIDIFWLWSKPKTGLWHSERSVSDDFSDRDHGFKTVLQRR